MNNLPDEIVNKIMLYYSTPTADIIRSLKKPVNVPFALYEIDAELHLDRLGPNWKRRKQSFSKKYWLLPEGYIPMILDLKQSAFKTVNYGDFFKAHPLKHEYLLIYMEIQALALSFDFAKPFVFES